MNKEEIERYLSATWAGREIEYHDIIDSTNNAADVAGKEGKPSGYLVVADRQDSGRGSRGRCWVSPAGYNIFMSLMVRPDIPMEKVPGLTLVMAVAVSKAVEEILGIVDNYPGPEGKLSAKTESIHPQIKWPNDVVLNKRKICGILTELHPTDEGGYYVVIGTGINVNQPVELFPEEIRQTAGSIFSETGSETDRSKLIALCMKYFEECFEKYVKTCDLSLLKDDYERFLVNIGREVRILDPKGEYEAVALGIDEDGSLKIELKDGTHSLINAGEVSVRGLYGYV